MDVNGVANAANQAAASVAGSAGYTTNQQTEVTGNETAAAKDNTAVVYEKSDLSKAKESAKKTYTPNLELVNKLKSDAEERASQLQSLVDKLIKKQGSTYGTANVFTSDFWKKFAASGDTIDQAAVKQAQEDIAEGGYWSVKETSSRILDFAKALTGGDPDKIDEMEEAFEKGYKQATKEWGDELPSISGETYKAVKEGFSQWRKELGLEQEA